jgi:hypothetical protein
MSTEAMEKPAGAEDDVGSLVRLFLSEDFAALDPDLPALLAVLNERRMPECWHKHGSFRDHLLGVYRILALWGQPREARLLGLLHSVYSNEYVDLALFDAKGGRGDLRALVGEETEALIHGFCTIPRSRFAIDLLERESIPQEGIVLRDDAGNRFPLGRRQIGIFLAVTLADLAEQWFDWQDSIMEGYPDIRSDRPVGGDWAAVLWPGAMRPSAANLSLLSRLARHMPALGAPVPPIFGDCRAPLTADDEAAATELYWQVACTAEPPPADTARDMLKRAIRHNPHVAEPRLALAQMLLMQGALAEAESQARQGLDLLCGWGTPWDKRIPWAGWVAWARLLLQNARAGTWPDTVRLHNNLGLVG